MYKKILGTLALAFSLVVSSAVFAHSGGCGEGMQKMLDSVKLDDSQKQKIKPIMENLKESMKQSVSQMKDLNKQINDQADSATMDQSAVNSLIDQKTKLIGDMMKAKVMAKNQIYMILTAQQKASVQSMMKKMHDKMEEKFKSCHDQD